MWVFSRISVLVLCSSPGTESMYPLKIALQSTHSSSPLALPLPLTSCGYDTRHPSSPVHLVILGCCLSTMVPRLCAGLWGCSCGEMVQIGYGQRCWRENTEDLTKLWTMRMLRSNPSQLSGESKSNQVFPLMPLLACSRCATQTDYFAHFLQIGSLPKCKNRAYFSQLFSLPSLWTRQKCP